jgi:hypothetical protein
MRREREGDNDAPRIPDCPACGKPLGLFYGDCLTCYAHADDYSLVQYRRSSEGS